MTLAIDGYLGLLIAIVGVLAALVLTIDTFATVLGSALEKVVAFVFRHRGGVPNCPNCVPRTDCVLQ